MRLFPINIIKRLVIYYQFSLKGNSAYEFLGLILYRLIVDNKVHFVLFEILFYLNRIVRLIVELV